jgi:hypothetical protein
MAPSGGVQFAFAKVQPTNKIGVKGERPDAGKQWGSAMEKPREVLLIAALAGLLIVGVAAFVVQPSLIGTLSMGAMQPASHAVLNGADLPLGPTA